MGYMTLFITIEEPCGSSFFTLWTFTKSKTQYWKQVDAQFVSLYSLLIEFRSLLSSLRGLACLRQVMELDMSAI